MFYIALLRQRHDGCDYTIGCGAKWVWLGATNLEDARAEIHELVVGSPVARGADPETEEALPGFTWGYVGDSELKDAILLEVTKELKMPLREWYCQVDEYEKESAAEKQYNKERAEYERLKKKFGS